MSLRNLFTFWEPCEETYEDYLERRLETAPEKDKRAWQELRDFELKEGNIHD